MSVWQINCADEAAMVALGQHLAQALKPGMSVHLEGDLGMGKTTLSRGVIQALGHSGAVKSPTYTLVEPYELESATVYHFDLYRLSDAEELAYLGVRDYFGDHAICLVEWPHCGQGFLPPADLIITISPEGVGRCLQIQAHSDAGNAVLDALSKTG